MRWTAPDGVEWDSRFEYEVFRQIQSEAPGTVRKTIPGTPDAKGCDTFSYREGIRHGSCESCGSTDVSKLRSFTPDLFYVPSDAGAAWNKHTRSGTGASPGYYAEVKGFMRANKRSLLRAFHKVRKDIDVRYILQRNYRVTAKLTAVEWIVKFLKCRVIVWDGRLPKDWQ
jgi:hypothetical protein